MTSDAGFGKRRFDRPATYVPPTPLARAKSKPSAVRSAVAPAMATPAARPLPIVTFALFAMLVLIFFLQEVYALGVPPGYGFNYRSLMALGAENRILVDQGQWWRILTGALLHANAGHLIGNGVVLVLVGLLLERLLGWGWFLAIFWVSAIAGSLASMYSQDPHIMGVGASGGIMGLLSATFVCSFHGASQGQRLRMRWLAGRMMIPALLPLGGDGAHTGLNIDYSAHAGGALAGAAMGMLMAAVWPADSLLPQKRLTAEAVSLGGVAAAAIACVMVVLSYGGYQRISATLAQDGAIPRAAPQAIAAASGLSATYPQDPRLHFFVGMGEEQAGNLGGAEHELRRALSETTQLSELPPGSDTPLRALLVGVLLDEGRRDEAKELGLPLCNTLDPEKWLDDFLEQTMLCSPY
jgi:membrane associated rhomboid family serine protease